MRERQREKAFAQRCVAVIPPVQRSVVYRNIHHYDAKRSLRRVREEWPLHNENYHNKVCVL